MARELTDAGKKVLIIDKRDHIAGNVYTEKVEGVTEEELAKAKQIFLSWITSIHLGVEYEYPE